MVCIKCGKKIVDDDAILCPNCGAKIVRDKKDVLQHNEIPADQGQVREMLGQKKKRKVPPVVGIIGVAFILASIAFGIFAGIMNDVQNKDKCRFNKCENERVEGGEYCKKHTCEVDGCLNSKGRNNHYCDSHKCKDYYCENLRIEGGEYCIEHTCVVQGCFKEVEENTNRCRDHAVDMREMMGSSSFGFSKNSTGKVYFSFNARNRTEKTIKAVRFNVYFADGNDEDIADEETGSVFFSVEIVGPFGPGDRIRLNKKLIGQCKDLKRIDIEYIEVEYQDGSIDIGEYMYYCLEE